jgi:hypothetical protein
MQFHNPDNLPQMTLCTHAYQRGVAYKSPRLFIPPPFLNTLFTSNSNSFHILHLISLFTLTFIHSELF